MKTQDGFELQFGSNHVGHFLATCLLAPALLKGAPSRIVSVSSRGHRLSPVVFDDIQFERRPYDKWRAYGQSKTANVLFAVALERRSSSLGSEAVMRPAARRAQAPRRLRARRQGRGDAPFRTPDSAVSRPMTTTWQRRHGAAFPVVSQRHANDDIWRT